MLRHGTDRRTDRHSGSFYYASFSAGAEAQQSVCTRSTSSVKKNVPRTVVTVCITDEEENMKKEKEKCQEQYGPGTAAAAAPTEAAGLGASAVDRFRGRRWSSRSCCRSRVLIAA